MKRINIVVLLLLFFYPIMDANAARGISVSIKDKSGKEVGLYKESHALIIGVSGYTGGWPKLPGVLIDVKLLKEELEQQGFQVVTVKDPNRSGLLSAYDDFINKYGQDADNRLLFYFAGHGYTMKLKYGGDMGYIIPVDAPNPNQDERGFLSKAVSMQQIEVYAKNIQSKHAMFLFDSCFSGSIFNLTRAVPEIINEKTSKPVRQFITSGDAGEQVPDESVFRGQFIAALKGKGDLNGDGYVTGVELGEFLQDKVVNYSKGTQHPKYGKIRDPNLDEGDFVFPLRMASLGTASAPLVKPLSAEVSKEMKMLQEEKERLKREREELEQKKALKDNMVKIPAGEFMAGAPGSLKSMLLPAFYIDKYEVTQREFQQVMGNNPSKFKGCDNCPVEQVTWYEADEYCRKVGKRLPTEWEWEKAAKAGTTTTYYWGESKKTAGDYAWYNKNSKGKTHPVGQKKPNGYGLYDMAGNVWEWTSSDYDSSGDSKILRGGSWFSDTYDVRVSPSLILIDFQDVRGEKKGMYGFRCSQ